MSSRGWENVTESDVSRRNAKIHAPAKPSKYRNVKTVVDGITFDSKREAMHYMHLKARQQCGEISELDLQVSFPLLCPVLTREGKSTDASAIVAIYVADFTYREKGALVVADAKGKRTREYALKAKWLALQQGLSILEI